MKYIFLVICFVTNFKKAKGSHVQTIVHWTQLYNFLYYLYISWIQTYVNDNISFYTGRQAQYSVNTWYECWSIGIEAK